MRPFAPASSLANSRALIALAVLSLVIFPARPVLADDIGSRITLTVSPEYFFSSAGDDKAPPPPGGTGIGYTNDHPFVNDVNVAYAIDFGLTKALHLSASHAAIGYQLARILSLAPNTGFVSGAIYDYTDTIGLSYAIGHGLGVHANYYNHQRTDVTGLCLNQKSCPNKQGVQQRNPLSIDDHGYMFGASQDFGFKGKYTPAFNASIDLKYEPRPAGPPSPNVALGGLGAWVGSQVLFPWSVTMKVPFPEGFVPFINYTNLPVLYMDSAVPEAYRGVVFGVVKVVSKNVTLSYTNLNLQSCRCIARVPPPDNLRLTLGLLKLDLHTTLGP